MSTHTHIYNIISWPFYGLTCTQLLQKAQRYIQASLIKMICAVSGFLSYHSHKEAFLFLLGAKCRMRNLKAIFLKSCAAGLTVYHSGSDINMNVRAF